MRIAEPRPCRRRALFVDDEPRVLDGQRRILRDCLETWDLTFALGGERALEALASTPYDVIVTDMRMPGVDGAALLSQVADRWPSTVRIVLSGQTDMVYALRAVRVAHQFLAKPCDASTLHAVLDRAYRLTTMIPDEPLRATAVAMSVLPSQPAVLDALERAVAVPEPGCDPVARIVEQDSALTAKLLQLANSSFFGLPRGVTTVKQATSYLGVHVLRDLVRARAIGGPADALANVSGFSLAAHQRRARYTAQLARQMLAGTPLADDAFCAGMLCDVGDLLVAACDPGFYVAAHARAAAGVPLHHAELALRGVTHATLGAFLLELWGLPRRIVDAVFWHHTPGASQAPSLDLVGAVHVADVLIREALVAAASSADLTTSGVSVDGPLSALDQEYVARISATERVNGWRAAARSIAADERLTGNHS